MDPSLYTKKSVISRLVLLLPMLAVAVLVGVAPFGAALRGSFLHDYFGRISPAGFENYRYILDDKAFGYSLSITVFWAFLQTVLTIGIAMVTAYRLWRLNSGRRRMGRTRLSARLLRTAVLVPWVVPVYIAVPVWRALIHGDGGLFNLLLQPFWGFVWALTVSVWLSMPATVFIFYSGLKKISSHVVEAAVIDGADDGTLAFSVCFPQLREIVLSAVLINFVKALKEFSVVYLMTAGGPPLIAGITERYIVGATTTLSVFLYDLFLSAADYGVSNAFSVLLSLVVCTATMLYLIGRSRGQGGGKRYLLVFPLVTQLLTGGPAAVPMAGVYLIVLLFPVTMVWSMGLHTVLTVFLLFTRGYPGGLQPALAVAAVIWMIRRGRRITFSPLHPLVWRSTQAIIQTMVTTAALLMTCALLWLSFSGVDAVSFHSLIPPAAGLRAYRLAAGTEHVFRYFYNSFLVAAATAALLPFVTFPAAWVIARGRGRTGAAILVSVQIIGTVSGMHALVPLYVIFRSLGMINTYAALILIYLEHSLVFSLYTISAFLRDLPSSLREAALLEGAGPWYYLRKVLMPLSRPVLFTAMVVAFLGAWNGFLPALLFIRDDWKYTIGVKIFTFVGSIASGSPRWSIFAATSVMNLVLLLFLFGFMRKRGAVTALSEVEE